VESAIQYAAENDVLLVHAAGNDGHSVDKYKNYPNGWNEATDSRYDHWMKWGLLVLATMKNWPHHFQIMGYR
jgi:cell wall-associated protease